MGDLSIYLVKLDERQDGARHPAEHRAPSRGPITWDEQVYLHWHPSSAVVVTQ